MQGPGIVITLDGGTFLEGEIKSVDNAEVTWESIDITTINNPSNTVSMEFEQGQLYDGGEFACTIRFLNQAFITAGNHAIVITYPGGNGTVSFTGFVTAQGGGSLAVNADTEGTLTIKVAGQITQG